MIAGIFVFQQFDGDIAEGSVGEVLGRVRQRSGREFGVAVLQPEMDGRLAGSVALYVAGTDGDKDVVVTMPVDQGGGVRRNFDLEDAHVGVLESEVMVGLGGDFDFLGSKEGRG